MRNRRKAERSDVKDKVKGSNPSPQNKTGPICAGSFVQGGAVAQGSFVPEPGTVPPNDTIGDASPASFYSAMSNIDFEIGEGNAARPFSAAESLSRAV